MALRCLSKFRQFNRILIQSTSFSTFSLNRNVNFAVDTVNQGVLFQHTVIRHNYGKKGSNKQNKFDEDEEEDLEIDDIDKNKIAKLKVQSLRTDLLIKQALGIARNKIETAFYEGKIRVNGHKISKKSVHCNEGDVIEIIRQESPNNPNHWIVARLELLSVKTDGEEFIYVTMKRFKSLAVDKNDY